MTTSREAGLTTASAEALSVRALYEILEQRFNGTTWSLPELMVGFSNDVGHIGRLVLASNGTWPLDSDGDGDGDGDGSTSVAVQLAHKLAESLWWTFVLADKLDIDIDAAFSETMMTIRAGLVDTITRTEPEQADSEQVATEQD